MGPSNRVIRFVLVGSTVAASLLLFPSRATVQDAQPYDDVSTRDFSQDVPAHFTVVEGQVMLERDAVLEPAEPNQIVMAGDRLRTTTGRTEILFPDGSTLQVDEATEIDFLSDSLMRLRDGRVRLAIKRDSDKLDYRIDSAPGRVEIRSAGDYLVGLGKDKRGKAEIDVTVFRGAAELVNDNGRTTIRAGRHAVTSADTEPSLPYPFNSATQDEFDEWVQKQRNAQVVTASSQSAQYLPQEVSYYANTLDAYGSWGVEEPYGAVWYPTVTAGWYPYYQGRWGYTKHYAYTWLGLDHWAWPTHHYGSWGYSTAGWYWVPGYAYAPAWVAWGYGPGYVGWCPIGPKGGPVYGWNGWYGKYPSHHAGPWTVLPAGKMGHNTWVTANAVRPEQLPSNARAEFTERRGAPVPTGAAIARRDVGSIGSPTIPRSGANLRSAVSTVNGTATGAAPTRGAMGANSQRSSPSDALSAFPSSGRVTMPDALPRAGAANISSENRGAAPRAVPRDSANGSNVFPSSRPANPAAARNAPRAEISSGFGRSAGTQNADGFPSSGAVRAVPRGLESSGTPASGSRAVVPEVIRGSNSSTRSDRAAVPAGPGVSSGSNGANRSSGSNGYRAVPQGIQSAPPVNRGRSMPSMPSNDAPAASSASRPVMQVPVQRSAPPMSAPAQSQRAPQVSPRGHAVSPAPASAPAPATASPRSGHGGGSSAPPPSQGGGTAAPRRGGGRG